MQKAELLLNQLRKKFSIRFDEISESCRYPMWTGDAYFISINSDGLINAPFNGYTPGGPESITNYSKKYLGGQLYQIASIVAKNGGTLHKYYDDFFIRINKEKVGTLN